MRRVLVIAVAVLIIGTWLLTRDAPHDAVADEPTRVLQFNLAPGFGGVHLNAPLELTFGSVTPDTIRIFTTSPKPR